MDTATRAILENQIITMAALRLLIEEQPNSPKKALIELTLGEKIETSRLLISFGE